MIYELNTTEAGEGTTERQTGGRALPELKANQKGEETLRKPMNVTPKKLEANRRNAQKSTGPKTAQGKTASKFNALKHGVLAHTVLVRGQQCPESPEEFKQLCQEFYADLAPAGPLEEMLVDQIIQASWRLRRARAAESGEIALSVDESHWSRHHQHPGEQWQMWEIRGDPIWEMEQSALGCAILATWLRDVRARVEVEGELTEAAIQIPYLGKPNGLADELKRLRQKCSTPPEGASEAVRPEEMKANLLAGIDEKLLRLEELKAECERREQAREEARQAAAVLPETETLEKILRYENALHRQLYRAMNELERLQRRRRDENVPAPLTMEVSRGA